MHRLANGGYVPASGMMPVARAMRAYCQTTRCDAGMMLGDNIYPDGATLGADGRIGVEHEHRQQRAQLRTGDGHGLPAATNFQRSQDQELHQRQ